MRFILNSKKALFALFAAILFSACFMHLPAEAELSPYRVSYYPNGGAGSIIVDNILSATKYTVRQNIFTRTGYTFNGWNTNTAGTGTNYTVGQVFTVTTNLNLYAKWKPAPIKITYYPNGGTGSNIVDSVATGTKYTVRQNTFTRSGYIFNGWNRNVAGTSTNYTAGLVIALTGNLDLYAKWKPAPIKITYYPNGGTDRKSVV